MAENPIQMFTNRLNLNRARGTRNQERELVRLREWNGTTNNARVRAEKKT